LDFLDPVFDVLRNEQMKAFKGKSEERSPASQHSDHTILGYEFNFKFWDINDRQIAQKNIQIKSLKKFTGKRFVFINHNFFIRLNVNDEALKQYFYEYKKLGFTGIQVGANHFISSPNSNEVFPQYTYNPDITTDWNRTPTREELYRIFKAAEETGLDCELRLELWMSQSYKKKYNFICDREGIVPNDIGLWFENYGRLCEDIASFAQSEGVEIFCAGVELSSMQKYISNWGDLVARIRRVFSGKITFAEATCHYLNGWNCWSDEKSFEKNAGKFWNYFDFIEMNCWDPPIEDRIDQRYSIMVDRFKKYWIKAYNYYKTNFPNKEIAFGELGAWKFDGNAIGYARTCDTTVLDYQELADVWSAYLQGSLALDFASVAVWAIELTKDEMPYPVTASLNGTPAIKVITEIFN